MNEIIFCKKIFSRILDCKAEKQRDRGQGRDVEGKKTEGQRDRGAGSKAVHFATNCVQNYVKK